MSNPILSESGRTAASTFNYRWDAVVVHGRVDDGKTEYSRDLVPLAPELAAELLTYRDRCCPTQDGWLFANPATDRPYHQEEIEKKHIRAAAKAAEITAKVGWKTFRHRYRSWLDET